LSSCRQIRASTGAKLARLFLNAHYFCIEAIARGFDWPLLSSAPDDSSVALFAHLITMPPLHVLTSLSRAGIADSVMASLLQMLKSSSGSGGVQEDALMTVGTLTEGERNSFRF